MLSKIYFTMANGNIFPNCTEILKKYKKTKTKSNTCNQFSRSVPLLTQKTLISQILKTENLIKFKLFKTFLMTCRNLWMKLMSISIFRKIWMFIFTLGRDRKICLISRLRLTFIGRDTRCFLFGLL